MSRLSGGSMDTERTMYWLRCGMLCAGLVLVLVNCGNREPVLPGERLDLRAPPQDDAEPAPIVPDRLVLDKAVVNAEWTHRNGSARHNIRHPVLNRTLTRIWSTGIGSGNSRKHQITADPVIAGGRIFTLNSRSGARAFSPAGVLIWDRDLTPPNEKSGEASGGGMAYGSGALAVTTGHGDVYVLDPATGEPRWRHRMPGAISAPPAIIGDVVVAVSRNNTALGLNITNGRILWQILSPGRTAGIAGAGAPAAMGNLAVIPYASGEVIGVVATNGLRAWSAAVTGGRKGVARGIINDISADPVIVGTTVYAGNQAGRIASIDRRSGAGNWIAQDGSYTPVWPASGAVFIVTDAFRVKRLNASDGQEVWSADLPGYKTGRPQRRRDAYAHFGPILAGGQIWVASSDGLLRSYDPETGTMTGTADIPGGAASQPAVADGVMYILSGNGRLHAYR
ncbi:MAG: PQQ-binding-like beta-propeller repeat protein [Rhodobacteraceae bacterium]|nr:PQQ-binding-like beta-propeller repeat protein [Paracoccaceae bacterium]